LIQQEHGLAVIPNPVNVIILQAHVHLQLADDQLEESILDAAEETRLY
jgi:hypothetical protein